MDSEEDERNREEEIVRRIQANDDTVTWDELHELIDRPHKRTVEKMDKILNSRWSSSTKKAMFQGFKILSNQSVLASHAILSIFNQIDDLQKAMAILNQKIETVQHKTDDFEMLTSEYDKVMKSFEVTRMRAYLDLMDKIVLE